jgi:ubiquinone/menaquinone biosynthesis C-methylase UbiE
MTVDASRVIGPHDADPKRRIAKLYTSVAPDYETQGPPFFRHAGRRLVEIGGVTTGQVVLDVATGRGAVLFPAADATGPTGCVAGIDLAEGMVRHTNVAIQERGLAHAGARLMDVEHLSFHDATFDRVLCSFAVFLFPDLPRVLSQMLRVLKPGGVAGFAFCRGVDPRWRWYEELLRSYGAFAGRPATPGHRSNRLPGELAAALTAAGFQHAQEFVEEVELFMPDEHAWWASLWTHGSRVPLECLPPDQLEQFKVKCLDRVRSLQTPQGLPERFTFVYVTGRRPTTA